MAANESDAIGAPHVATRAIDVLPPEALVAMLTLRLRDAEQQADRAEALATAAGEHDALAELRIRLASMLREREQVHKEALERLRARAAADIEFAKSAAAAIAVASTEAGDTAASNESPGVEAVLPTEAATSPAPELPVMAEAPGVPAVEARHATPSEQDVPSTADVPIAPLGPTEGPKAESSLPSTVASARPVANADRVSVAAGRPGTTQVVVDAEVLGRVLASVFSSMLDERLAAWAKATAGPPAIGPGGATARPKAVWQYLRQPDVALIAIATTICAVVLVSWMW